VGVCADILSEGATLGPILIVDMAIVSRKIKKRGIE
jgi:hypothetical protein